MATSLLQTHDWEVDSVQGSCGGGDAAASRDSDGREREREGCSGEEDGGEETHIVIFERDQSVQLKENQNGKLATRAENRSFERDSIRLLRPACFGKSKER